MKIFYEVIRIIEGKPLFLEEHLERLKSSIGDLSAEIKYVLLELLKHGNKDNFNLKISVNSETLEYEIENIEGFYPPKLWYDEGIDVLLINIKRDNPKEKVWNPAYKEYVKNALDSHQVYEGIIFHDALVGEGTKSNVFFLKGRVVISPKLENILPGITRIKVLEALKNLNIEFIEKDILISELKDYDGAFHTGTSIDVLPIRKIIVDNNNLENLELTDITYPREHNGVMDEIICEFKKVKEQDLNGIN